MSWIHGISALTLAVLLGACGGAEPVGEAGHDDDVAHAEEGFCRDTCKNAPQNSNNSFGTIS